MLDIETLRIAQAGVAACAFLLVYAGTYRRTRTPFAGWWSAAMLGSGASSVVYLLAGVTDVEGAAALGNAVSVTSAGMVWAAARSLRGAPMPGWWWWGPGAATLALSWLESPTGQAWPGGATLLVGMGAMMACASRELWLLWRATERNELPDALAGTRVAVTAMAVASTAAATFYAVRALAYLAAGPDSYLYTTWLGPEATTFLVMLMLVVVSYSVAELVRYESAHRWHAQATRDDLTGLFNRNAFRERALEALSRTADRRTTVALLAIDLDHFKAINDTLGHAGGDRVLVAFAQACLRALGPSALVGRWGGEEFLALVPHAGRDDALLASAAIDDAFAAAGRGAVDWPTISCGIAVATGDATLDQIIGQADAALYRAKRHGRARTEVHPASSPAA